MKNFFLLLLTAFLFLGCSSKNLPLETVNKVDIQKLMKKMRTLFLPLDMKKIVEVMMIQ